MKFRSVFFKPQENREKHDGHASSVDPEAPDPSWNTPGSTSRASSVEKKAELIDLSHVDPVLQQKVWLVNNAIDEIGLTSYTYKLFFLSGFGYAVDSLVMIIQSILQAQIEKEFPPTEHFPKALTISLYLGLFVGALFWGISADIIGRQYAFNLSLLLCGIFALAAGAAPNYITLCALVSLSGWSLGGNLVLDTTIFLEFVPSKQTWLLTGMAAWWGVGQVIAGLVAWPFLSKYSCETIETCTKENNMGWRYTFYTLGAFVFLLSMMRVLVIRLHETPKWLLAQHQDAKVVESLNRVADSKRSFTLTTEQLVACGDVDDTKHSPWSLSRLTRHVRGLYTTKVMGYSTSLIFFLWALIGLGYPLYTVFLPYYLQSRGADTGDGSIATTYRNFAIVNTMGIFGPLIACFLVQIRGIGRRGSMVIGALLTMTFLFAYTAVRTAPQNLGFNCAISVCLNIFYGTLFAYTPEVLPSAHRGTGNGIAVSINRISGMMSPIIANYADTSSSLPMYIGAALFLVMAIVSCLLPYEPLGNRSI